MAEEFSEKIIEKVWEYMLLYDTGHLEYKNLVKKAETCRDDFVHPPPSPFSFTTQC
jgi:hypothetical protein